MTGLVFFAAEGALVVFVVRYRRRQRQVDAEGPQIHGNTRLEVLWTVIPVFLVAIIVAFVFYKLPDVSDVSRAANEPASEPNLTIDVRGHQFYWEYRYPDGSVTYDTMVVPVGRTVELNVTSQIKDVIHSWWIPALGGKIDAIPGKLNHTWFRAEREGVYVGNCAEFCGLNHARMEMSVHAVPAGSFDGELSRLASNGREQFNAVCAKCHNISGPAARRPDAPGQSDARRRPGARAPSPERPEQDAAGGCGLERRADPDARRLHEDDRGRRPVVAVQTERIYPVPWHRGRYASWLVTTDHKRIGILYIATASSSSLSAASSRC